jgi:hypothetical protein
MADYIRFERAIFGESTVRVDCPMTTSLTREHVLRSWVRWLGADGWSTYGPYSVEVGFAIFLESDGSLVETNSVVGQLPDISQLPPDIQWSLVYELSHLGIGVDDSGRHLDGYVRMWETRRNPLHRLEATWKV